LGVSKGARPGDAKNLRTKLPEKMATLWDSENRSNPVGKLWGKVWKMTPKRQPAGLNPQGSKMGKIKFHRGKNLSAYTNMKKSSPEVNQGVKYTSGRFCT